MTAPLNSLFTFLSPLWEMSLTAAYAAAVVVLLRLILRKRAPKQVLCLLWLVVFARLLIPVSLESPLSILPDAGRVQLTQELPSKLIRDGQSEPNRKYTQDDVSGRNPAQNHPSAADPVSQGNLNPGAASGSPALAVPEGVTSSVSPTEVKAGFPWQALLAGIWLMGVLAMDCYGLVSYLRLRRRLFDAIRAEDGAWEHPSVGSPFILGILRPKIYLPAGLYGLSRQFILCHERAHLRRLDHIIKPLCWAALALHWFNPAAWIAFVLMSRDIEAACDEAVIRRLGPQVKADYSATLLSLATNGRVPAPCPLAFDEGNAKSRIQNVLRYRRPALWVVVVSFVMATAAAVCLLTDPVAGKALDGPDSNSPAPESSASQSPEVSASQPLETGPARLSYPLPTVPDWAAEVLSGKRKSYNTYLKQQMDIQPLNAVYGYPDSYFDLDYKLALVDLDGDGTDEVILEPCYTGTPMDESDHDLFNLGYLILRRQGDDVYSYNPSYRSFYQLKADSTFVWSGGAGDWGIASARFSDDGFEANYIAWCQSTELGEELYFVDGLAVGMEEFNAAWAVHDAEPAPTWYRWYEDTGLLPAVVRSDQSTYTPKFLGNGMRELYRQASYFYYHLFGESTAGICDLGTPSYWPSACYDPTDTVERDALTYVRATGQFARWTDLMAAADALFTRDFWNACNIWDGHELFINVDGDTYFLPVSRVEGDYFRSELNPFTLVEQTDTAVTVTLTVGYNRYRAGESEEQWSQRASRGSDYTVDYPIRLMKTENGWRFDEFHHGRTDHRKYRLGHILWQTDPIKAVNGWMDEAVLSQVGPETFLDWDGTTYQIEPDVNHSTFTGRMYVLDVDEDGQTEASLVYLDGKDSPVIAVYERTGQGLRRHTFHVSNLLNWYDAHISVERNSEGGLTLTYRSPGDVTSIELSDGVFESYEWLREGEIHAELNPDFFYVGLAVEAPLTPPFGTHSFISLSDGVNDGPYVASAGFQVEYDGSGFTIGKLWWEPYTEFAVVSDS